MKKSAWYNKLWQKKMDEFPLPGDADKAWEHLQDLLDKAMPVENVPGNGKPVKSFGMKLISILGYTLPAAAMIYVGSYVVLDKHPAASEKKTLHNHIKAGSHVKKADNTKLSDSIAAAVSLNPGAAAAKENDSSRQLAAIHNSNLPDSMQRNILPVQRPDLYVRSSVTHQGNQLSDASGNRKENNRGNTAVNIYNPGRDSLSPVKTKNLYALLLPEDDAYQLKRRQEDQHNLFKNYPAIIPFQDTHLPSVKKQKAGRLNKKNAVKAADKPKTNLHDFTIPSFAWGIKTGVNTKGSFTPKSANANFYGKFPADLFFGVFGAYALTQKWAVSSEILALVPQTISGEYTHPGFAKPDTGNRITIKDSRKIYTVDVPVTMEFRASKIISFKAGPVISIPVKQANKKSIIGPVNNPRDTLYYSKFIQTSLNNTTLNTGINWGITVGISLHIKRIKLDATYLHNLNTYKFRSDLGAYRSPYGSFQMGLGIQLGKTGLNETDREVISKD